MNDFICHQACANIERRKSGEIKDDNATQQSAHLLEQLAQLILKLDMKEGVSPAGLGALQMFAKSALENAAQHGVQADVCPITKKEHNWWRDQGMDFPRCWDCGKRR